ncbi:protein FAR1-RELATED SEQUENCE 5-like [Lycium barbarum]|uniref:protein FAR1-RELATED SEQUENCE 5-like n=1 Tax=Lycium barbarum TaxID=112863 RepID=UPI00293EE06A|nr:protein FAR1-RELATED SEQUENCE 5-like [Lycium barbarum]
MEIGSSQSQSGCNVLIKLGMEFDSDEHAYEYYNKYAGVIGFSVRREYANKNKVRGYVTSRKLVCYKEGYRDKHKRDTMVQKHRNETRTGCLAHFSVSRQSNGMFRIPSFEEKHNHPLVPSSLAHMLPSQRKIKVAQAYEIDLLDDSGICPKASFDYAARQVGGQSFLGYTRRDQKNYLRDKRKDSLKHGVARSLVDYFEKQILEDPAFRYSLDLDDDGLITNVLWADGKMIRDFKIYGDVVSFDTTYRTNKEYRPLALFVGLNNHREMVIFGAALLYEESTESFVWLFNAFFKIMSADKPQTFFTDQDPAISAAISFVMPKTYHRLCVWHLEKNAFKHLNHIFRANESFPRDFSKLLYDYEYEEDFLSAWQEMLEKYDLEDNSWLKNTFVVREKWSMTYGRHTFSAGMRSTQLSESFNGFLRGYLKSDLDIVQFFKHFQRSVDDKRANENKSNFDMTQRIPILKVKLPLLIHAREVYTPTIFDMFQNEWERSLLVSIKDSYSEGELCTYNVSTLGSVKEHAVTVKQSVTQVSCSCKLFEFLGILCRHALKILDLLNVKDMIPVHYILKRWTKDASNMNEVDIDLVEKDSDPKVEVTARYRHLCHTFVQISSEASESTEGYELAAKGANEIIAKLKDIKKRNESPEKLAPSKSIQNEPSEIIFIDNTNVTKVTGLKRKEPTRRSNTRPKSFTEKSKKKGRTSLPKSLQCQTKQC